MPLVVFEDHPGDGPGEVDVLEDVVRRPGDGS